MSRKLYPVSAALALAFLLLAAPAASAQDGRLGPSRAVEVGPAVQVERRVATLGCCKCLGGTNTLDLSTIPSNAWTVNNGNPVSFLTSINPSWDINLGPAKWVSTTANGGTGSPGTFEYRLDFYVPECTIGQNVTLTGNVGGDNGFQAYLDNSTGLLAQCNTGWCFSKAHGPLQTFTKAVNTPGHHTLIVRVDNGGGPSGMFVNATLAGACRRE